jgi:hypothetical protein
VNLSVRQFSVPVPHLIRGAVRSLGCDLQGIAQDGADHRIGLERRELHGRRGDGAWLATERE